MACLRRCIITLAAFITKPIIYFKEIDQNIAYISIEIDQNLVCVRKLVFLKVKVIFTNIVIFFVVFDPCCQKLLKEGSLSVDHYLAGRFRGSPHCNVLNIVLDCIKEV